MKSFKLTFMTLGLFFLLSPNVLAVTQMRGVMISPNVQASDIQLLGQWNVNYVRWQLHWPDPNANSASPAQYSAWLQGALHKLDSLLPVCQKAGIKVLIDLHSLPGGVDPSTRVNRIFTDSTSQAQFLSVWKMLASRYSGNSAVWGYDLANEPIQPSNSNGLMTWWQLAATAAQNIRAVDSVHTIVVEPANGAIPEAFNGLIPLPPTVSNVVYSVHMYNPHEFTHQGNSSQYSASYRYPGVVRMRMWDKAQILSNLQPVINFQKKYNTKILVGEFSAVRWAPAGSAYNYLKDCISIFEENGWDWSYHAFREYNGWSVELTDNKNDLRPAAKSTNREQLLRSYFKMNFQ